MATEVDVLLRKPFQYRESSYAHNLLVYFTYYLMKFLQDALEFFLHFLDQVERQNSGSFGSDPARSFKFGIEDRIVCSSGKVAYNRRHDYILSLNIPLHEATNKGKMG